MGPDRALANPFAGRGQEGGPTGVAFRAYPRPPTTALIVRILILHASARRSKVSIPFSFDHVPPFSGSR